jgi:hypothetical protein
MVRLKIAEAFPVGRGEAQDAPRARLAGRCIAPDPKAGRNKLRHREAAIFLPGPFGGEPPWHVHGIVVTE